MAVKIKSANLAFLLKMGVPLELVSKIKVAGITFKLGVKELQFKDQEGMHLYSNSLPVESALLDSSPMNPAIELYKTEVKALLEQAIAASLQQVGYVDTDGGFSKVKAAIDLVNEAEKKKAVIDELAEKLAKEAIADVKKVVPNKWPEKPSKEVILLKDAGVIYQRVKGTSQESVYVLVAITADNSTKVAARIKGTNLSVRIEGDFNNKVRDAFINQGLDFKKGYMSGHFTCNPKVSADRVVGAILMGSGLEYATPLPSMEKVRALCE